MTQTVGDLLEQLRSVVPFDRAAGWDPVGLQIGDPEADARRMAVCHELTDDVVARLESDPVDVVVAYHPLLFEPTRALVAGKAPPGRAFRLIRSGTAVITVHTAFDVAPGGASDALAFALGLEGVFGFGPLWPRDAVRVAVVVPAEAADRVETAMAGAGAGVVDMRTSCSYRSQGLLETHRGPDRPVDGGGGELREGIRLEVVAPASIADRLVAAMVAAHPDRDPTFEVGEIRSGAGFVGRQGSLAAPVSLGELAETVSQVTGGSPRTAGSTHDTVSTIAVVPGSGASFIPVVPLGSDVLVTGDVTHHRAREALSRGVRIVDPGHAETESPGLAALYAAVRGVRPDAVDLTRMDSSPWRTP